MAVNQEDMQKADAEFGDAFNESEVAASDMSDDEAFGLMPENVSSEGDTEVAIDTDDTMKTQAEDVIEASEAAADPAAAEGGEMPSEGGEQMDGEQPSAAQEDMTDDEPTDPKEIQRKKSWEGRLRKREEELAALAAELEARKATPSAPAEAEDATDSPREQAVEAVEDAIEAIENGDMTADQAIKTLSEDFGPEFAKMLQVLIKAEAGKVVSKVSEDVDSLIEAIKDDKARGHFEAIADVHPDFHEIGNSPEMEAYLDGLPEEERAAAGQVIEGGSTRQVIRFLDKFKKWQAEQAPAQEEAPVEQPVESAPAEQDESAMDAAEGVRSTGLRLPAQPGRSDDYEDAWSKF